MKRKLCILLCGTLAAGMLTACGGKKEMTGSETNAKSTGEEETVTIWHDGDEAIMGVIEDTVNKKIADEIGTDEITLMDIVKEIEKPGRDPRDEMPKPVLKSDVLDFDDLKEGMILKGTVRNVIDFGAFVDIGVHQDGLVHISELSDKYIKHPLEVVSVGDIVDVKVLSVDKSKKRIQLTMKNI